MPKQKQLLKVNKKKEKSSSSGPETADEFLAAGVDAEEAGEKWRAGDAAKSCRFFVRAIELYDAGLQRFATSFDLAYNRARLQYELSQQPRLLAELPTTLVDLLQLALESHRGALMLRQDDADTLFNTAQVLTSLGELLSEGSSATRTSRGNALNMFQEALELFQRCFAVQEYQLNEAQAMMTDPNVSHGQAQHTDETPIETDPDSQFPEEEQWASIVEPTTANTLLDTTIAQIETLTVISGLMISQDPTGLPWLEDYSTPLLKRATELSKDADRSEEVVLARANFLCSYADATFRTGRLDLPTYQREVNTAWSHNYDLSSSPQGLCDRADASIALVSSIRTTVDLSSLSTSEMNRLSDVQWKHLSKALADLTAAGKLPNATNLSKMHLRRGDCELWRYRLGAVPSRYEQAITNATLLLKNAQTYYRGSAKLAQVESAAQDELEACVKEAVASKLDGDAAKLSALPSAMQEKILAIVEEMRDEGLLSSEDLV